MAIGTPASLGSANAHDAGSTTIVLTVSASVAVGEKIFVFGGTITIGTTMTVADSAGNSYTVDKTSNANQNAAACIASAECTSALTSGVSTITITFSASRTERMIAAAKVTGIAVSSPLDVTKNLDGTVVGWTTTATTTTTQAVEIAFAVCCNNAVGTETDTPGGTPAMAELFDFANSVGVNLYVNWVILSSTQTVTGAGTATDSGGRAWNALVATYKGAAAAASLPPAPVHIPFMR